MIGYISLSLIYQKDTHDDSNHGVANMRKASSSKEEEERTWVVIITPRTTTPPSLGAPAVSLKAQEQSMPKETSSRAMGKAQGQCGKLNLTNVHIGRQQ